MEGVVVSVVTGAMKSLLPKLTTLLNKYKLSKGVKKEISCLRDDMSSMNALLVELSKMEELDEQDKEWRDKVRELSYDIEDCVDIFTNDLGSDNAGIWKKLKAQYKIADRIQELKARMVEASNCRNRYKLDVSKQLPDDLVKIDPRMQVLYTDTASLVGTDRARDKIIGWLMDGEQHVQKQSRPCFEPWNFARFLQELYYLLQNYFKSPVKSIPSREIKVITIVGIGGAGKTALANQIYSKVKSQFNCTAFVTVSRNPSWVKILSDVLFRLGCSEPSGLVNELRLIDLIREHLKDKSLYVLKSRYLIVIDDVWTVKEWDTIKCFLVGNNLGSRVIITTRNEDVAQAWAAWHPCFDGHVYRIRALNDFDSRRLFHKRIFGSEDACPMQLKAVSDEIVKKCGGLPLAVLSVASILGGHENSIEIWENFRFHLERNPGFDLMRHVLSLGYNDLSMDLKTCMLYLGIFPEDSRITKDDLLFGRIDKMKDLRTLNEFDIDLTDVDRNVKGLGELTKLRELTLSLSHGSKQPTSVGKFLLSALCNFSSLRSLIIRGSLVDADALTRWHAPSRYLRRLHVLACPFSTVPADWITQLSNLRSLEIKVVSLTSSGAEVLARLTLLVHLRLHVEDHAPEKGVIIHSADFPELKKFCFTYRVPCLVFKSGAMPKLQALTIQCYANAERQADGVLDGIEHLRSLNACKVVIAEFAMGLQAGQAEDARQKEVLRWDKQVLEAALRKAINKHPGSPDITIQTVHYGLRFGTSHDYKFWC
ncbi:hypothetical protein EJB05_03233, partial [Eragrostis curvula]